MDEILKFGLEAFKWVSASAIVAVILALEANWRARRELAIKLHETYLSPEFYAKVRAPAFHIRLQWEGLPSDVQAEYRKAVASGWSSTYTDDKLSKYVAKCPSIPSEVEVMHFQQQLKSSSLTEHQALTAYLSFWTRLNTYKKIGSVNHALAKKLFRDAFRYNYVFLNQLADDVQAAGGSDRWVEDVRDLTEFFGFKYSAEEESEPSSAESQAVLPNKPFQQRNMMTPDSPNPLSKGIGFLFSIIFGFLVTDAIKGYLKMLSENVLGTVGTFTPPLCFILFAAFENFFWSNNRSDTISSGRQLIFNVVRYCLELASVAIAYDIVRCWGVSMNIPTIIFSSQAFHFGLIFSLYASWNVFQCIECCSDTDREEEWKQAVHATGYYIVVAFVWFIVSQHLRKSSYNTAELALIQTCLFIVTMITYIFFWRSWFANALGFSRAKNPNEE